MVSHTASDERPTDLVPSFPRCPPARSAPRAPPLGVMELPSPVVSALRYHRFPSFIGLIDYSAAGARGRLLSAVVIYGANASGKSNLISALNFMRSVVLSSHSRGEPGGGVPPPSERDRYDECVAILTKSTTSFGPSSIEIRTRASTTLWRFASAVELVSLVQIHALKFGSFCMRRTMTNRTTHALCRLTFVGFAQSTIHLRPSCQIAAN
jgi:hypothetical protein